VPRLLWTTVYNNWTLQLTAC